MTLPEPTLPISSATKTLASVSLRDLFPDAQFMGSKNIQVRNCTSSSLRCLPGDVFVAMVGSHHDGHDYVQDAIDQGASAIVAERSLPVSVPTCVVENSREAFGKICQALAGNPSKKTKVIGVTGTNGKTTTCYLIKSILEAAGQTVGISSSMGYDNGFDQQPWQCSTPDSSILADLLSRMEFNGCSHAVVEASSHALAQDKLAGIDLDAAVFTNIRQDHIDFHGTVKNYHNAKAKLLNHLRPSGFAIFNADDPGSEKILNRSITPALTVALHGEGEITASVVERHKSEQTFLLSAGNETVPVCTRMIGDHHIYNCLLAAAVGLVYGFDLKTVVRGLEAVDHVPGRMERIEQGQPFGVFVDYAHTQDALAMALKALRRVTHGRLICVYGAGGDCDRTKRPMMGRVAERGSDISMITTDNPRSENPMEIIHDIMDGYDRPAKAHVMPNRREAIKWAINEAQTGDTVLIAGRGNETHQLVRRERIELDDRQVAKEAIRKLTAEEVELSPVDLPHASIIKFPRC
ncbi:MAG: UDP-N-acetylmuramoyl-L-alanyl-D-glutamate--2,6-diaminopimelate ligase [Blastopirellula sp.]|nr:MAG: UDP-N-acetylmuramoyl-L-alanyl-D-glutamate--2,6-diaminopimelate ligase [Blastopirellula sp.]